MTEQPDVVVLADPDGVAAEAASRIATALASAVEARGRADWATTGGSSAPGIYRHLAEPPFNDDVPWGRVHLWWGDERYVPRDNPLSNAMPADEILLRVGARGAQSGWGETGVDILTDRKPAADIPVSNIHAIPMGPAIGRAGGPEWAAATYEEELRASGIAVDGGWPVFDLVVLGVGPDGHVMSVFPGSAAFERSEWVLPVPAPSHVEPHISRVTLNPRVIEAAREVLVVSTGSSKADVLGQVFGSVVDPRRWPAQLARRRGATWLLDDAAAARLENRQRVRR
ncbi:MAG TPA: 6-phosphogluconolactonase [Candidatus Limnocylindrales bacterium]|nr:6-phosphogluconolactonase [Candidatus Limnocylindrales bacterium]